LHVFEHALPWWCDKLNILVKRSPKIQITPETSKYQGKKAKVFGWPRAGREATA